MTRDHANQDAAGAGIPAATTHLRATSE